MRLCVFDTGDEMNCFLANRLRDALSVNPRLLLCIAAGHTSLGLFERLIAMEQGGELDFTRCRFVAMDEWKGMNEHTPGSCGDFLRKGFLSRVRIAPENTRLVNGAAESLAGECAALQALLDANGGIDFLVLGSGMNGHLALNEPGTPTTVGVHETALDAQTSVVGQKYFTSPVALTGGVTLGLADVRRARAVYLAVSGAAKRDILRRIVDEPVTERVPATALRGMDNATLVCDRDAAALLAREKNHV